VFAVSGPEGTASQSEPNQTSSDEPTSSSTPEAQSSSTRIFGGTAISHAEFPWQVALATDPEFAAFNPQFAGNAYQRQFCGGSLVAPRLVITAAHCVFDSADSRECSFPSGFENADCFTAVTGRTQLSSSAGQEIEFSEIWKFVDGNGNFLYNDANGRWDVVVVELAANSVSQGIQIAGGDEAATWAPGIGAFVSGWGDTSPASGNQKPDSLLAAFLAVLSDSDCAATYGPPSNTQLSFHPDVNVCAAHPQGAQNTCGGDSGGPLVVPVTEANGADSWRLVGNVNWGLSPCGAVAPAVFGRLAGDPYRSAIQNFIQAQFGVNVVGSGAQPRQPPAPGPGAGPANDACAAALDLLKKAKKQMKRARAKFRKADSEKEKEEAEVKINKARKAIKRAKEAIAAAC
jgi:secreted trypsin-like serine protease